MDRYVHQVVFWLPRVIAGVLISFPDDAEPRIFVFLCVDRSAVGSLPCSPVASALRVLLGRAFERTYIQHMVNDPLNLVPMGESYSVSGCVSVVEEVA